MARSTVESNRETAVNWLRLVSAGDVEQLCLLTSPTWTMEGGPPDLPPGHDGVRMLFGTFGDITQDWSVDDIIAEGDKVVLPATNRCTQDHFLGIPAAGVEALIECSAGAETPGRGRTERRTSGLTRSGCAPCAPSRFKAAPAPAAAARRPGFARMAGG